MVQLILGIYNTYIIPLLHSIYQWEKAIYSLFLRIKLRNLWDNDCSFEQCIPFVTNARLESTLKTES